MSLAARQRRATLEASGMTVKFSPTPASVKAYKAVLNDSVASIEGVPSKQLSAIRKAVLLSVMRGGDMHHLSMELQRRCGFSVRRAAEISIHQNNMAKAVMERTRRLELGITEAIWRHSGAGRNPRPSHIAFSGQRYDIRTGAFLDGKWVWPGSEPGCLCTSKAIIPAFED
jgi:uncharacterized protein with gpF-like domain